MKNKLNFFLIFTILSSSLYSQIAVAKLVGKDAGNYKLGYGLFAYYDIPINEQGNRSIRIELLDIAYFPSKNPDMYGNKSYVSIK